MLAASGQAAQTAGPEAKGEVMNLVRRVCRAARFGAVAVVWAAAPAGAMPGSADGARFAPAMSAMDRDDWGTAAALAAAVNDPAARTLVQWRQLGDGEGGFGAYREFLARHPDWPQRGKLRRLAEERMPQGLSPTEVEAFFAGMEPLSGTGSLRLADALASRGKVDAARQEVARAWREMSLTPSEEQTLLAKWGGVLAPYHIARLDMLLWRGLTGEAERMMPRVDGGRQALARARIALRRGDNGVNGLIAQVPAALQGDAGLAYERFRWRASHGMPEGAEQMILERSTSAEALGKPSAWAGERRDLVRAAEREGRARTAYLLAARHFLRTEEGYDYADLEWLAGWIALRRLNDPAAAEAHFANFTQAVNTPISLGRGWYWLGRAREAKGDRSGAQRAYEEGARWQTSFYGQLAAERAGAPADAGLAASPLPTDWRDAAVLNTELVRAGVLAHHAGDRGLSHWLLTHAAKQASNPRDLAALGQLALELERPEIAVRAGKAAADGGLVLATPYYPVVDLAGASGSLSPALALSIARQESEMNPQAISHAGARGLMQLMPGTAQLVAKRLGMAYNQSALTSDWRYNARLGTDYLAGLVDEFRSVPLAAAGYNAGPGRVRQWLATYGDPRGGRMDMVDWIETIPFDETRNYVQRVMEGLHVYQARLTGRAEAPALSRSLR